MKNGAIDDEYKKPTQNQGFLRRLVSCENRNSRQSVRLVWRSKSDMQYQNLEKVLGLSNHRKNSLTRDLSVSASIPKNSKADSKNNSPDLCIPPTDSAAIGVEVKINKERVKVPSVKGLKTFFETFTCQQDAKISRNYQSVKKVKINALFLRTTNTKDIKESSPGDQLCSFNERNPKIGVIGKTVAIEKLESSSLIHTVGTQSNLANYASNVELNILKDSAKITEHSAPNNAVSEVTTNNVQPKEISMIETTEAAITLDDPSFGNSDTSGTKKLIPVNEGYGSNANSFVNIQPISDTHSEPKINVSEIRAKWENIFAESSIKRRSSMSVEDSILLNKLRTKSITPRHNWYGVSNKNNIFAPINATIKTRSETDPVRDRASIAPKGQLVGTCKMNDVKPNNDMPSVKTNRPSNDIVIACTNFITEGETTFIKDVGATSPPNKSGLVQDHLSTPEVPYNETTALTYSSEDDTLNDNNSKGIDCLSNSAQVENDKTSISACEMHDDSEHGATTCTVSVVKNTKTTCSNEQVNQAKVSVTNSTEVTIKRDSFHKDKPDFLSPKITEHLREKGILAAKEEAKFAGVCRNSDVSTSFAKLDTSVSLPLYKEHDNLQPLQRTGSSRIRPLHPDELSFFQNPLLNPARKGRSNSDASYNRK